MDQLLPTEETMRIMAEEYKKALDRSAARADVLCAPSARWSAAASPCPELLLLYIVFVLGYNFGYGNALADAYGDMGRVQSGQGRDGNFHHFFQSKR